MNESTSTTNRPSPGPRQRPRPLERQAEQPVELTHVPERERAQEAAQRRRRRRAEPEQPAGPSRPQHVAVVDRVGASDIAITNDKTLRATFPAPTPAEIDAGHRQSRPDQGATRASRTAPARVGHRPLVIEHHVDHIQSGRPVIVHHEGDLLCSPPDAATSVKSAAQEVILRCRPDGNSRSRRWIQAESNSDRLRALNRPIGYAWIAPAGGRAVAGSNPVSPIAEKPC